MTAVNKGRQGVQGSGKGPRKVDGSKMNERGCHKMSTTLQGLEEVINEKENAIGFNAGNKRKRLGNCKKGGKNDVNGSD
jgi:hypothetical protein